MSENFEINTDVDVSQIWALNEVQHCQNCFQYKVYESISDRFGLFSCKNQMQPEIRFALTYWAIYEFKRLFILIVHAISKLNCMNWTLR